MLSLRSDRSNFIEWSENEKSIKGSDSQFVVPSGVAIGVTSDGS